MLRLRWLLVVRESTALAAHDTKDDWESITLRRVTSRAEPVATPAAAGGPPAVDGKVVADDGYGWEESVLPRLRNRLFGDDSLG
jgi:hypothetical protein